MVKTKLEFFLNGKRKIVVNPDPQQTVLDYVRSTGLTGTKLGCSEGGCGACTVSVTSWDPETKSERHYAINGCIVPIIAVDGKHLITVEGIGNSEEPHAAQERIAKFHGSQCGFCTPGIVMSLYSLLRATKGKPNQKQMAEAFDGNLCRCTGYKPIIDAVNTFVGEGAMSGGCCKGPNGSGGCCKDVKQEQDIKRVKQDDSCCGGNANGGACCKDLNGSTNSSANGHTNGHANGSAKPLKTPNGLELKPYPHTELIFPPALKRYEFELLKLEAPDGSVWYRPTTIAQIAELVKEFPNAHLVGGASEFQIEAKIKGDEHPVVIFVLDVPELQTFEYIPGVGVKFGANIALSVLETQLEHLMEQIGHEKSQYFEAVVEQLKYFAGRQIRNVATPAGNIATASPISDLNPVFVAADAKLFTSSPTLPELSMGDAEKPFFVGYRKTRLPKDGILTHVLVPESKPGNVVRAYKQAKRKDDDISIVTACMSLTVDENSVITAASLSYGGVAPWTVLSKSSPVLLSKKLTPELLPEVLNALDAEFQLAYSVPGGMAIYRRSLIMSFFYKFLQSALEEVGHPGADLEALVEVTRTEKPLGVRDLNNEYVEDIIGTNHPHLSAMKQVTGEALYLDDIPAFARELHGVQVLSTKANAKIKSIDYTEALEVPGVEGYVDINDLPGDNQWGALKHIGPDLLFVKDGRVRYVGDCIALILADTREAAVKAVRKVKIEYEEFEPIVTIEQAIAKESYFDIFPLVEKGNFDEAAKTAAHVFEGECRMGAQEHFYLETQGSLVVPEDNGEYKVYASTQNPNETQLVVATALGIPANRVVAKAKRLGGGFGGKETRSVHYSAISAIAAKKFKLPIRTILSRQEDMLQAGQRHPFLSKWRVALDANYKFIGLECNLYANAGYSMDLTKGVMDRAVLHVDNCYDFGSNIYVKAWPCKTNLASNTAFRGFGGPQGMFVAETIIYNVSEALGIEPDDLRNINYYPEKGGVTHYGNPLGDDFTASIMAKQILEDVKYDELRKQVDEFNAKSKWVKRGLAHVPTKFGISFGVQWLNQAGALVHIYEDGSILLAHGGTEMGQGLHTKMVMICAAELGVPMENVFISETATNTVANASPTAASASSDLNGGAVKNACDQLNERLAPYRKKFGADAPMSKIAHAAYFDRVNLSANGFYKTPEIGFQFGVPNPKPAFLYFTQGSAVSMVEVNTLTGDWSNLKTDILMDIGRPINQAIDYGQIEGAFVQGMGLFTMEESLWLQNGSIFTRGPGAYKIPGFRDIPQEFNVRHLQGRPFSHLSTIRNSKGIGEPPLFLGCTVMFAIRDAIKAARKSNGCQAQSNAMKNIEAPMTTERIRIAVGDSISEQSKVPLEGKSFILRS